MQVFKPTFRKDSYTPKEIYASEYPLVTASVTIAAGQTLERGAVLGRVTSGGAYVLSAATDGTDPIADGSQVPVAVLAENVDASAGAEAAIVYISGHFESRFLTFGTGHTAASVRDGLRGLGIYVN